MYLTDIYNLMERVGNAKGTTLQKKALRNEADVLGDSDREELKEFLHMMLDPRHTFGVTWGAIHKARPKWYQVILTGQTWTYTSKLLGAFARRLWTPAQAIDKITEAFHGKSKEDHKVLKWLLDRKNPWKIGRSIVNSVFPDLIYKQEYMGAVTDTKEHRQRLPWSDGIIVQEKLDSKCFMPYYNADTDTFRGYSRQGQEINIHPGAPLYADLMAMFRVVEFSAKYQGELMCFGPDNKPMPRPESNGILSKLTSGSSMSQTELNSLRFGVWDCVCDGSMPMGYEDRFADVLDAVFGGRPHVFVPEWHKLHSPTAAQEFTNEIVSKGGEGCIAKTRDGLWKDGKPWYQVKFKPTFEAEMEIIEVTQHAKKLGQLGSFIVRSADGLVQMGVGTGLTDAERGEFWRLRSVVGRVITVKFNEILPAKGKQKYKALGNPAVFVRFREAGTRANTYKEILEICQG